MSHRSIKDRVLRVLEDEDSNVVVDKGLTQEMESSFLEYAMSVIKSRALPDYRDGLKPVHRRIIYAAAQEGLTHDKKYKKSAAIVGSVMGSYHPHGDMAIYDALVRMAQDFSLRYPLIQGQGNFGSIDGDSPAAMRYTEARLSELCSLFIGGLGEDWVEMMDNYDQSRREPVVLPTLLPNLLVNGSEGIAVGLATKIPPHNLSEIIDAAVALIRNPDMVPEDLEQYVQGPDFPTGGELLDYVGVRDYFGIQTSKARKKSTEEEAAAEDGQPKRRRNKSFRLRGRVEVERDTGTSGRIIIREIPYGVKKPSIIRRIVQCMDSEAKNGTYVVEFDEYIRDIRDESSRNEIRVVVEYNGCRPEVILNNLYKHTRLQITFSAGIVVLVNNEPKTLNLLEVLRYYRDHQMDMLRRQAAHRISVLGRRIHILEGRLAVVADVMEAIGIITASDEPDRELQERFGLSEEQLKDVLDLRVRSLKKLSVHEMKTEMKEKTEERLWNRELLDSPERQREELIRRLTEVKEKYGDGRKTVINKLDSGFIAAEDTKNYEDMVFIMSKKSYLSQVPLSSQFFRMAKKRRSKSCLEIEMYRGDALKYMISCHGTDDLLFFTDRGRVFRKKAYEFRLKSGLKAKGRLINNLIPGLEKGETVVHMMRMRRHEYQDEKIFLMFVTQNGFVKKTRIREFRSILSNGKLAILFGSHRGVPDRLKFVFKTTDDSDVMLVSEERERKGGTKYNRVVRISVAQFHPRSRHSRGRKAIALDLDEGQGVLSASSTYEGSLLVTIDSRGYGKFTHYEKYRLYKNPGCKGVDVFRREKREKSKRRCIASMLFNLDDDILMTTSEDKIYKFRVSELGMQLEGDDRVRGKGKTAKGVRLLSRELEESHVSVTYYNKLPADAITSEDHSEFEEDLAVEEEEEMREG